MKIYFCDGCNESVPLADLQSGEVTTIKGKLFCRNCIPPGTSGTPAPPPETQRSGSSSLLVFLVVLLLGWTIWRDVVPAFLEEGPEELALNVLPVEDPRQQLDVLDTSISQLQADGGQRARDLTLLRADLEALRAADADHARSFGRQNDELQRLGRTLADTGAVIEKVHFTANRTDRLEARVDGISDSVAAHETALSLGVRTVGDPQTSNVEGLPPEPAEDPARLAAVDELRRLLQSPEPDLRFEGVDRVNEGDYVELAPELVGLLKDPDMFIRLDAMKVLGNFGYEEAVPTLFEVLEDDNAAIRKKAAETLVRLMGYDPGYDPRGTSGERSRAVNRWREWYAAR